MDKDRLRDKGILLQISRIDRNVVNETWLYKARKIRITIYDPSPYEIQNIISKAVTSKKMKQSKFDDIMAELCTLRRKNKRIRRVGKRRKKEKGLRSTKLVDLYIEKKKEKLAKKRKKKLKSKKRKK